MLSRTNSTDRDDSKYYSEKGIAVCTEWKDYKAFKEWALSHGYKGVTHTITEWCRITGKSWTYIDSRLKAGKTAGVALGYEK